MNCWELSNLRIGGWPHGAAFRGGAGPVSLMTGGGKEGMSAQAALCTPPPASLESEAIMEGTFPLPTLGKSPAPLHPSRKYSLPSPGSFGFLFFCF